MRTSIQVLLGVAAMGACWAAAPGCASGQKVIQPIMHCLGYAGWGYWQKEDPPEVTVCSDGSAEVTLQFKGQDGQPIPGGGTLNAPGCVTLPIPPAAGSFDWVRKPQVEPAEMRLLAPIVLPVMGPGGAQHKGGPEYVFGCSPLKSWSTQTARGYELGVQASSLAEAQSLAAPFLYHGAGAILPPEVGVHFDVEADMAGSDLVIRSSLRDEFDHFRIDVDGQPVADLGAGLNVRLVKPGARWVTVVATIPLSLLSDTMDMTLVQRGETDPDELQLMLVF